MQNMELIPDKARRTATFHRRKTSLFKKASELTAFCDIPACIIVSRPDSSITETWPPNSEEVSRVIDSYKTKLNLCPKNIRTHDLHDFYKTQNEKLKTRIARKRKNNDGASCAMWDDRIHNLSVEQLREILGCLDKDILEGLNTRIIDESIKKRGSLLEPVVAAAAAPDMMMIDWSNNSNMKMESSGQALVPDSMELGLFNGGLQPICVNPLDQMLPFDLTSSSSMVGGPLTTTMMFLNDDDWFQLGGTSGGELAYTPPMPQFYYDPTAMMIEAGNYSFFC